MPLSIVRLLIALLTFGPSLLHAQRIVLDNQNISSFFYIGGPLRLACLSKQASIGSLSKKRLIIGAVFKGFDGPTKAQKLSAKIKKAKRLLKQAALAATQRASLLLTIKKLKRNLRLIRAALAACQGPNHQPSSSSASSLSASSSPAPVASCANGTQDNDEQGIDCGPSCPFECPLSYIMGIDVTIHGTPGKDYAVEWLYHDKQADDAKVIYLKGETILGLKQNDRNQEPALSMRYKIDRDEQSVAYYEASISGSGPLAPTYTAPFSLSQLNYPETGAPVVGTTGDNGQPYYQGCTHWSGEKAKYGCVYDEISKRTYFGINDSYGDEWHILTFWDDAPGASSSGGDDDASYVLLVVDPKTPLIRFRTLQSDAQFYTTPAKTYWIPKIFEQTTYLTDNVEISLVNIMSGVVSYRINDGATQNYTAPFSSNSLNNGLNTIEYWYGTGPHKRRTIVKNPSYPSGLEQHPHNFLWSGPEMLDIIRQRITRDYYRTAFEGLHSAYFSGDESQVFNGFRFTYQPAGPALNNAFVSYVKGAGYQNEDFARKAKKMLLDLPYMSNLVGFESWNQMPGKHYFFFYYQGTASGRDAISAALAYDLLIGDYKTENGYVDGFTPIEDIRVRDSLAYYAKTTRQFKTEISNQYMPSGTLHWGASSDLGTAMIALVMPQYDSIYYGTSGAPPDLLQATHPWAPFPNYPNTWWDTATNEYPQLYPNPDQSLYSQIKPWILAQDGTHTPNLDFHDNYWGNVKPLYIVFANAVHNAGINYDLSAIEQKFNWYINEKPCDSHNEWCKEFPQVNKHFSHALNAYDKIVSSLPQDQWYWWVTHYNGPVGGISFFDDTLVLCTDGVQNGYEAGIDCGGTCPDPC